MGYDMETGTVVRWLAEEGSEVGLGEAIAEIETDKAVVEFESTTAGILHKILVPEGSTVPVGEAIAIVGDADENIPDFSEQDLEENVEDTTRDPVENRESTSEPTTSEPVSVAIQPQEQSEEPLRASPVARKLSEERGIDLRLVKGTGPGGRITKNDVLTFSPEAIADATSAQNSEPVSEPPQPDVTATTTQDPTSETIDTHTTSAMVEKIPMTRMRQQIARVTVRSKQETPHYYISVEIDMTAAMSLRKQINSSLESEGVRASVNDLVIKACVSALGRHPKFNASFAEDGVQLNPNINIGIAIAEEEGLIVPAIMDCKNKSLREIAAASSDLIERSNGGTLHPQEYTGGTFSISNMGMFDITSFIAIILPPQSAMLAVGSVAERPVARDGQITLAHMMNATLSADHRVSDGAEGAQFILDIKNLLENPMNLVL